MTSIFEAIGQQSLNELKKCIARGDDVNQHDEYGQYPLIAAVRAEHYLFVDLLLRAGADVNGIDLRQERTALDAAKEQGQQSVIELLQLHRAQKKNQLMIKIKELAVDIAVSFEANPNQSLLDFLVGHADQCHQLDKLTTSLRKEFKGDVGIKSFIVSHRAVPPTSQPLVKLVIKQLAYLESSSYVLLDPCYYSKKDYVNLMDALLAKIRVNSTAQPSNSHWLELATYCHQFDDYRQRVLFKGHELYYRHPNPSIGLGFLGQLMLTNSRAMFELMLQHGMSRHTTQFSLGDLKCSALHLALILHVQGQDEGMFFAKKLRNELLVAEQLDVDDDDAASQTITQATSHEFKKEATDPLPELTQFGLTDQNFLSACAKAVTLDEIRATPKPKQNMYRFFQNHGTLRSIPSENLPHKGPV